MPEAPQSKTTVTTEKTAVTAEATSPSAPVTETPSASRVLSVRIKSWFSKIPDTNAALTKLANGDAGENTATIPPLAEATLQGVVQEAVNGQPTAEQPPLTTVKPKEVIDAATKLTQEAAQQPTTEISVSPPDVQQQPPPQPEVTAPQPDATMPTEPVDPWAKTDPNITTDASRTNFAGNEPTVDLSTATTQLPSSAETQPIADTIELTDKQKKLKDQLPKALSDEETAVILNTAATNPELLDALDKALKEPDLRKIQAEEDKIVEELNGIDNNPNATDEEKKRSTFLRILLKTLKYLGIAALATVGGTVAVAAGAGVAGVGLVASAAKG